MKYWRTPLDIDRVKIPTGEVHIIRERCKGCGFCVEYCPKDILVLSEEFNSKGYLFFLKNLIQKDIIHRLSPNRRIAFTVGYVRCSVRNFPFTVC
jgi:ferredoxin